MPLLIFSSAQVFNGLGDSPYDEETAISPQGIYGATKAEGEARVLSALASALVVRTGVRFSPWEERGPVFQTLQSLAAGRAALLAAEHLFTLTYLPDLVHACLDLLLDGASGLWHLSNAGVINQEKFLAVAAELLECQTPRARPVPGIFPADSAACARNQALVSRRAWLLPTWQSALGHFVHTRWPLLHKAA